MKKFLLALLSLTVITANVSIADDHAPADTKAVLVTGATSGIGRATAELLASNGYLVYAGARKDKDMEELNKIKNITAVRLDVTKQDQIDSAVKMISDQGHGLWGLVNNAGVNVVAPMTIADEGDLDFLFQVNVYGVFRVTQAFAPMILESKGRIINISSISGVITGPGYGMYGGTKHALEAFTDSTMMELQPFGVHVAAVNPGNFASEIGLTRCKRLIKKRGETNWGRFEERRQQMIDSCEERLKEGVAGEGTPPDAVARTVQQALFEDNPRERYLVVPRQREAGWTVSTAIEDVLRFNNGHEHSYARDELVELLDKLWPYYSGEKSRQNEEDAEALRSFMQTWMTRGESESDQ